MFDYTYIFIYFLFQVKKNQTRALMILESKNIPYVAIDITDPGQEEAKDYMLAQASPKPGGKVPVPPQIFNEADYCGVCILFLFYYWIFVSNLFGQFDHNGLSSSPIIYI